MNILIVSGAFYPSISPRSFRTTELAKQFVRLGHKVSIFIPENKYDYNDFKKEYPISLKYYWRKKNERKFTSIKLVDRIIFRALNQLFDYPNIFLKNTVYKAVKNETGYDLLITIAVPHQIHWAFGRLYNKGIKAAKTWIADCGDPYMLNESGKYKPMFYFKGYEKLWCKQCNFITVPTENSKQGYYPEFRNKIRVIPQGFNFDDIITLPYTPNKVSTFAYSGSFIPDLRDPRPILDYLFKTNISFTAIFYTRQTHLLANFKSNDKQNIIIKDYIPRIDLIKELSQMDFLLNISNGDITAQTPSKLIDYALTKRPILNINSRNIDKNRIDEFLNGNYTNQLIVENLKQYDIKEVANQFLILAKLHDY